MTTVDEYRTSIDELVRLATIDLDTLIRGILDGEVARELLADILPELAAVYGGASAAISADWYDELRDEARVTGRFRPTVAPLPDRGRTDSLARWAVEPLFAAEPDTATATTRAGGGLQRIIADSGRSTIMQSSIADPKARGWRRIASGRACGFCRMLADRGAVYSESGVDFGAHDHCGCSAAPAFDGDERGVSAYVPSTRDVSPAERARTRAWMREHGY